MPKYNSYTVGTVAGAVEYWRIDNDTNGNPRYVIHFMALPYSGEDIQAHYRNTARLIFGQKYRAKWFGGGVVFQSFNVESDIRDAAARAVELAAVTA